MRTRPTVESLAKVKPRKIPKPKGLPSTIKDMLDRENNLLRQMSASGYNLYRLAETTQQRPPVATAATAATRRAAGSTQTIRIPIATAESLGFAAPRGAAAKK